MRAYMLPHLHSSSPSVLPIAFRCRLVLPCSRSERLACIRKQFLRQIPELVHHSFVLHETQILQCPLCAAVERMRSKARQEGRRAVCVIGVLARERLPQARVEPLVVLIILWAAQRTFAEAREK